MQNNQELHRSTESTPVESDNNAGSPTQIERCPRYYPQIAQSLSGDDSGGQWWGVALENTQLTYFEVPSHSRFERHSHESEQITMVLEGVLFFESNNVLFAVQAGDVIAIPSMVPHTVYTLNDPVRAIDAWSPVHKKYVIEGK